MGLFDWLSKKPTTERRRGPAKSMDAQIKAHEKQYLDYLKRHDPETWLEVMEDKVRHRLGRRRSTDASELSQYLATKEKLNAAGVNDDGAGRQAIMRDLAEVLKALLPAVPAILAQARQAQADSVVQPQFAETAGRSALATAPSTPQEISQPAIDAATQAQAGSGSQPEMTGAAGHPALATVHADIAQPATDATPQSQAKVSPNAALVIHEFERRPAPAAAEWLLSAPGATEFVTFVAQTPDESLPNYLDAVAEANTEWRGVIVWLKSNPDYLAEMISEIRRRFNGAQNGNQPAKNASTL